MIRLSTHIIALACPVPYTSFPDPDRAHVVPQYIRRWRVCWLGGIMVENTAAGQKTNTPDANSVQLATQVYFRQILLTATWRSLLQQRQLIPWKRKWSIASHCLWKGWILGHPGMCIHSFCVLLLSFNSWLWHWGRVIHSVPLLEVTQRISALTGRDWWQTQAGCALLPCASPSK